MGKKNTNWSDAEKQILLNNLDKSDKELSEIIGRSQSYCQKQRIALGIRYKTGRKVGSLSNNNKTDNKVVAKKRGKPCKKTLIFDKLGLEKVNLDLIIPKPKPIEKIIEKAVKKEKPKKFKPRYDILPGNRRYEMPKNYVSQYALWNL